MIQGLKCRHVSEYLGLSFLQVLLVSACATSSRTLETVPENTPKESEHIAKISNLPAAGAWLSLQFVNDRDCFFATPESLWRSSDAGKTWELLHHAIDYPDTFVKVQFLDSTFGWLKTNSGWYKSEDGGRSWVPFQTPLFPSGRLNEVKFLNRDTGWIAGAALRPASSKELGSGGVPNVPRALFDDIEKKVLTPVIYRTDDGGRTWKIQKLPSSLGSIEDIAFMDADHGIVLSGPDAFHTRDGGKTWQRVNDPRSCIGEQDDGAYEGKPSSPYLLDPSLEWVAFDDGRILRTTNGGQTWIELQPCDQTRPVVVHFSSQDRGYGLGSDRFLYKTTDGGKQWNRIGADKYDAWSFLDNKHLWLISEHGLYRVKMDQDFANP
jgi:photosystem II stability/assembly factor-like uncharacterized protein